MLIPYHSSAEDHQTYKAQEFSDAGAAVVYHQSALTAEILTKQVCQWLRSPEKLQEMANKSKTLAIVDSAERLAAIIRNLVKQD